MCVVPAKGSITASHVRHGNAIDFLINYHRIEFRELSDPGIERSSSLVADGGRRRGEVDAGPPGQQARRLVLRPHARRRRWWRHGGSSRDADPGRDREAIRARIRPAELTPSPIGWPTPRNPDARSRRSRTPAVFEAAGLLRRSSRGTFIDNFRNRLIFPIRDELGRPIAFGRGRSTRGQPKYLNSPESEVFHKGRTLYGRPGLPAIARQRTAIVCEGYTDVIALHDHGFEHAVATLGTAPPGSTPTGSPASGTVILLFDGDAAGRRAADRHASRCSSRPRWTSGSVRSRTGRIRTSCSGRRTAGPVPGRPRRVDRRTDGPRGRLPRRMKTRPASPASESSTRSCVVLTASASSVAGMRPNFVLGTSRRCSASRSEC